MGGKGKPVNKTQQQIQQTLYTQQIINPQKRGATSQESRANIELVRNVYNWPDEDILRVLQDCNNDPQLAITRIADGSFGEPAQWEEVVSKRTKADSKPVKSKEHKSNKFQQGGERSPQDGRSSRKQDGKSQRSQGGKKNQNKENSNQGTRQNVSQNTTSEDGTLGKSLASLSLQQDSNGKVPNQASTTANRVPTNTVDSVQKPITINQTSAIQQPNQPKSTPISYSSKVQQSMAQNSIQQTQPQTSAPSNLQQRPVVAPAPIQQPQSQQQQPPQQPQLISTQDNSASQSANQSPTANGGLLTSPTHARQAYQPLPKTWKIKESKDSKDGKDNGPTSPPSSSTLVQQIAVQKPELQQPQPQSQSNVTQQTQLQQSTSSSVSSIQQQSVPVRLPASSYSPVVNPTSPVVLPAASLHALDSGKLHREVTFGSHDFDGKPISNAAELPKSKTQSNANTFAQATVQQPQHGIQHPTQAQLHHQHQIQMQQQQQLQQMHQLQQQQQQQHELPSLHDQSQLLDYQGQPNPDTHVLDAEGTGIGHHPMPPYSYMPHAAPHLNHPYLQAHPFQYGYETDPNLRPPMVQPIYDPNFSQSYQPQHPQREPSPQDTKFSGAVRNTTTGSQSQNDHTQQYNAKYASQDVTSQGQNQSTQPSQRTTYAPYQTPMYYPYNINLQYPSYQIPQTSPQTFGYMNPKFYQTPNYSYPNPSTGSSSANYSEELPGDYKHQANMFPAMHSAPFYLPPEIPVINQQQSQQQAPLTSHTKTSQPNTQQSFSSTSVPPTGNTSGDLSGTGSNAYKPQGMYTTTGSRDSASFYNSVPQYSQQTTQQPSNYAYPHVMQSTPYSTASTQRNQQTYQ